MSKMGQSLSVCTTQPSNVEDTISDSIGDVQLPPIGALYIPTNNGLHKFIYDHTDDNSLPCDLSRIGRNLDYRNRATTSLFSKDALKHHRPAFRYSKSASRSEYDKIDQPPPGWLDSEIESDQESVMTTVSPCKDRNFRSNSSRNNSSVPSLQLRLPVQRSLSFITPAIPSRPSIYRISTPSSNCKVVKEADSSNKILMWEALHEGDMVKIEKLLLTVSAVNVYCWNWPESHGDMILHLAVRLASPLPLLQLLLRYDIGGGPVTPNDDGDTPISLAGKLRQFELLACLMQALQAPYLKTPDCPLRLSTNTYEGLHDCDSINPSPLRSSWSSTPSSLHLSLLFGSKDIGEGENEQEMVTGGTTNVSDNSLEIMIKDLLRDMVDDVISAVHLTHVDTLSDIHSILPIVQQSSPCTAPLAHSAPAKYTGSGRSRSSSLVSESDEWCMRSASEDSGGEEVCRRLYFAPPPSPAASSHRSSSNCTFSITEKNASFPIEEVHTSIVHSVTLSTESNETAVSCNKCPSSTKINSRNLSQENEYDHDDLFCCSPFLSPPHKGIPTSPCRVVVSPMVTPTAAVSPLSVQPAPTLTMPSSVTGSGRDDDYGLFVDLDVSQSTVSPQTTKFNTQETHTPNGDSRPSANGETQSTTAGTKHRVSFVPRPLRKATGRLVRFIIPTFHKHK